MAQFFGEAAAVKDVVAQYQRGRGPANEVGAEDKRLGQPVRAGLNRVADIDTPLAAVPQQLTEGFLVAGRGDDQDIPDAGQHQGGQRVVDHGLVVHRHQLLADGAGEWMQARP